MNNFRPLADNGSLNPLLTRELNQYLRKKKKIYRNYVKQTDRTDACPKAPFFQRFHNKCTKLNTKTFLYHLLHIFPRIVFLLNYLYDHISLQIGCCGADGPNDYMYLRQPLPLECRDSVTGNAFFNGCVDELIWYLEDKSVWVAVLGMTLALLHVSMQ